MFPKVEDCLVASYISMATRNVLFPVSLDNMEMQCLSVTALSGKPVIGTWTQQAAGKRCSSFFPSDRRLRAVIYSYNGCKRQLMVGSFIFDTSVFCPAWFI